MWDAFPYDMPLLVDRVASRPERYHRAPNAADAGLPASIEGDHVLDTVRMIMTSGRHIASQEKNPARLDRRGQRDADGVQGHSRPHEGLLRFAEFHSQALDGPRKGVLPQEPFDSGMQLFKIIQAHWPLSSAAELAISLAGLSAHQSPVSILVQLGQYNRAAVSVSPRRSAYRRRRPFLPLPAEPSSRAAIAS